MALPIGLIDEDAEMKRDLRTMGSFYIGLEVDPTPQMSCNVDDTRLLSPS